MDRGVHVGCESVPGVTRKEANVPAPTAVLQLAPSATETLYTVGRAPPRGMEVTAPMFCTLVQLKWSGMLVFKIVTGLVQAESVKAPMTPMVGTSAR